MFGDNQGRGETLPNPQEVESAILSIANDLHTVLGETMEPAIAFFPQKPVVPTWGNLLNPLWPKTARHDVANIHPRVKILRRLASLTSRDPAGTVINTPSHTNLWQDVNTILPLRTELSLPPKDIASLGLLRQEDLVIVGDTSPSMLQTCFKGPRRATRLLIRHTKNLRCLRYGKTPLRLIVKKLSAALKSILRTSEGEKDTNILPTYLSIIRDEITGHLITAGRSEDRKSVV